ncbi:MAG: DEAD/DEAH box helicase [Acidimicrobiales bacterium]
MTTFQELGVAEDLVEFLAAQGIDAPFPIQILTIADGLLGRDVCGKAKTGSGKTLAFSLPVVQLVQRHERGLPTALMLTPTRELANQIFEVVQPMAEVRDLRTISVYGGTNIDRQIETIAEGIEIVVATPGRLIDLIDRGAIDVTCIEKVVVDEADRMADMGFLPQVEWILRRITTEHQTMLFSATLDGVVDTVIQRHLSDPVKHEVDSKEVTVDQMGHLYLTVHHMDKPKVAASIIRGASRAILFTRTKRGADRLERDLRNEGVEVAAIHGDLRQKQRESALSRFTQGKIKALVATDVAARGIHVDDVDVVIHYDPPDDHKTYLHRSGRTARAGESGTAVTLVLWDEELNVRQLQRRLGMSLPMHEVFSNDERLLDLPAWVALDSEAESSTAGT